MEGGEEVIDPLELCKTPKVIKDAQDEIGKLDVFVCGECHDVFHYIEPFQEHRQKRKCTKISVVRENYKHEPKAQVWAFMLWKNAQLKKTKEGENTPTSWIIYQRWCKLNSEEKDAWVVAGQTIQSFTKISTAKVQEIKSKMQTPVVKNKMAKLITQDVAKSNEDDLLEEGEIRLSQLTNAQRVAIKAQVATNKANPEVDPLADVGDSEIDSEEKEKIKKSSETAKKTAFKPVQNNNDVPVSLKKPLELRKAMRTGKNENMEETVVERILSRRFNNKKKCMEYFIKWENLNETENTWEPKHHLEKCKTLLEEFDKVFNKPKMAPKPPKRVEESHSEHSEAEEMTPGRPQRTCKQKALNQVKVWCGDITDSDELSSKRKSFSDDEDSSDSFEKKIKLEEDTDSSEDEKPSVTIRRIVKAQNSVNGVSKKSSESTLSTSTQQRVVRVSQKQLPSLSSGVYIMSKTEGIIKLDSNTPSAGSPLLRVGPKIGQTHIKMVKKETGTIPSSFVRTPMKTVSKLIKTSDTKTSVGSKPVTKVVSQQRRTSITSVPKPPVRIIESNTGEKIIEKLDLKKQKIVDEDSDGLEELEFPTDLPLPAPDSPPADFTLCPLTGKILGQNGEPDEQDEGITENTSLDILVKQAVAELPDVNMDISTCDEKIEDGDKTEETVFVPPLIATTAASDASISCTSSVVSIHSPSVVSNSPSPVTTITTFTTATTTPSIATDSAAPAATITATPTAPLTVTHVLPPGMNALPTPMATKSGGVSTAAITTPIMSSSKIATNDDIEERLTPNTIEKSNLKETLTTISKPRHLATGPSILNAALTNTRIAQHSQHMGPPKKLISTTPHTIRQKVTTINRSPINRPTMISRPSPSTTIIHKISLNKNRSVLPKTVAHQEPILRRTSSVTTYKPAGVARRIGNTTIYKTSEKPQPPSPIKAAPPSSPTPITTVVAAIAQPTLIEATSTVISMPLLTTDEEPAASENVESLNEIEPVSTTPADTELADLSTFSLPDSETPLFITGEDGTIYQVAGQNEEGQTILISEGPDGQQQCVVVSSESASEETAAVMMDTSTAESDEVEQTLMVNTQPEETEGESGDGEESQVVAQIIKADPPSPGGTRKVVLMLPDGNLMMTDVTAEQYAALELDK